MCPSHVALAYAEKASLARDDQIQDLPVTHTAEHESGHAVVACELGFRVLSIRIVDDDPADPAPGATAIEWGPAPADATARQEWAVRIAAVCFAGFFATAHAAADEQPNWQQANDILDDVALAAHTLTKNVDGCRMRVRFDRLMREARDKASAIVMDTIAQRRAVSAALLAAGRLTEHQLGEILKSTARIY